MSDRKQAIQYMRMLSSVMKEGDVIHLASDNLPMVQNVLDELKKPPEGLKPYGQRIYFGSNEVVRMKKVLELISDKLLANGLLDIKKTELPDKRTIFDWRIKAVKWDE